MISANHVVLQVSCLTKPNVQVIFTKCITFWFIRFLFVYSFKYNQQDVTLYNILYHCRCSTFSGGFSAHQQELKNCTHSIWYVPGLKLLDVVNGLLVLECLISNLQFILAPYMTQFFSFPFPVFRQPFQHSDMIDIFFRQITTFSCCI
jgi:hypothetical protein